MGWKDLVDDTPLPTKRGSSVTLTTRDLKEPYDIVDVVFVSKPVSEFSEALSSIKEMWNSQDIGSGSFQEIKSSLRARAVDLNCDAIIGVTIGYASHKTITLMTGTGTAVRTHRKKEQEALQQRIQQASPINPGQLLVRAGLPQYIATFGKHKLSAARVPGLVEADLISAGISDPAHRHTIIKTIHQMLLEQQG